MSTVFLVEKIGSDIFGEKVKYLAVKKFNSDLNITEIRRELSIWLSMDSKFILPLYSIGDVNDCLAAISPWRKNGTLSLDHALRHTEKFLTALLFDIVNGLDYAWKNKNVVHLDIKPNNIFLSDDLSRYELADWGVSKISSNTRLSCLYKDGSAGGTIFYMAPERFIEGNQPSIQNDMFSIGIMILYLIEGQVFYNSYRDYIVHINSYEFKLFCKKLLQSYSSNFKTTILKLLDPNPKKRFNDYDSIRKQLKGESDSWIRKIF